MAKQPLYSEGMGLASGVWARRIGAVIVLAILIACNGKLQAQTSADTSKPLPDVTTLMYQVEEHQKASEALVKDYMYHSFSVEQRLDGSDRVKKTETEDADIFYIAGSPIRRVTKRNGQPLSSGEQKKEQEHVDRQIEKAKKTEGKPDPEEVTVSRFLQLGSFTNPRRIQMDGRDTIMIDFAGNPKARTRNRLEGAIRDMAGTLWVDEQDKALRKVQGHFVDSFKVGGGLVASIKKGSSFDAAWTKVNGEVWLPSVISGQGEMRALLLFNFHGTLRVENSNYRKFKATVTILPGLEKIEPADQSPAQPPATDTPKP